MKTEIIEVNKIDEASLKEIQRASTVIANGGLVVFPTETVYGLGADATNPDAALRIYKAKGRPSDNPLIIHVADPKDAEKYAYTNNIFYTLAENFMPGPITVILKSRESIPPTTRGGLDTVAVRCPSNEIARSLIKFSGVPIAAPSANLSGSPSPTTVNHVIDDMLGRVDVIINGGPSDFGLESTIVKINDDESITLLRPGKITLEDLRSVCGSINVAAAVTEELEDGEVALSPGMKYRHYAPKAELVLLDGGRDKILKYIKSKDHVDFGMIVYSDDISFYQKSLPMAKIYDFGNKFDEEAQAHKLFFILREADKDKLELIYAPTPRKSGVGLALYNRMIRAAAHKIIKL